LKGERKQIKCGRIFQYSKDSGNIRWINILVIKSLESSFLKIYDQNSLYNMASEIKLIPGIFKNIS